MISIVVYGRNDHYGYNMDKRGALGLNCMAEVMTDDDDEILFVDYNTADDFPTFPETIADTLTDNVRRRLRILRVRPAHHALFAARTYLPVLESIARNVAVRRSNPANRWILSTNTEMVLVPRVGDSLSEIASALPRGFYAVPRFELPESLWESFDRLDPHAVLRDVRRLGWEWFLNEVVFHDEVVLYSNPGDFQLIEREDLFKIDGFNESMLLGWHIDANLFRRLSLLHNGAPASDLSHQVFAYHCAHTRQMTVSHRQDAPMDNYHAARWTNEATLPGQRDTWGLATVPIEEISLQRAPTQTYLHAVSATLPQEGSGHVFTAPTHFDYDPRHVLPFLLSEFVNMSPATAIVWFGREQGLFRLFLDAWRAMGAATRLLVPHEFADALRASEAPGVEVAGLVASCERADVAIVDFARSDGLDPIEEDWRGYRLRHALGEFVNQERLRLKRDGKLPRRVITVGAIDNAFEPLVNTFLDTQLTPFNTRVRGGYALGSSTQVAGRSPDAAVRLRNTILAVVPTRSRPHRSLAVAEALLTHSTRCDLLVLLDEDDPALRRYPRVDGVHYEVLPRVHTGETLNRIAHRYQQWYDYFAVFEDDQRVATPNWDGLLVAAIADLPMGMAYGNDPQGETGLPTMVMMNTSVVRALDFMVPPGLAWEDKSRFWGDLGQALGSLRYREDVVIERLGPLSRGEPSHDEDADRASRERSYEEYRQTRFPEDVRKLQRLLDVYWRPMAHLESR